MYVGVLRCGKNFSTVFVLKAVGRKLKVMSHAL
jgi:hypothetical protein